MSTLVVAVVSLVFPIALVALVGGVARLVDGGHADFSDMNSSDCDGD